MKWGEFPSEGDFVDRCFQQFEILRYAQDDRRDSERSHRMRSEAVPC